MENETIHVTKPALPPLEELIPYLETMWNTGILTNQGPLHRELEARLADYLGVDHVCLFSSGMAALVTAMQSLDLSGEVITTPYSFAATANAIAWNGLKPVFSDIGSDTPNIDPSKIEQAITARTCAIMPVHCYGFPCDTDAIERIATRHGLKVLYDAAHAFGVRDRGGSVLRHGDLSVLSFHATKVFNTFEGGAVICRSAEAKARLEHLRNFGLAGETQMDRPGLNGKMSEFNAAVGLLQLRYVDQAIAARQAKDSRYRERLAGIKGLACLSGSAERANFSYFPVLVTEDFPLTRDELHARFAAHGIHTRRYFYPLLSDLGAYRDIPSTTEANLPAGRRMADRILCLPIYPDLSTKDMDRILAVIAGIAPS